MRTTAALLIALVATAAYASNETLYFSAASNGDVLVAIAGQRLDCGMPNVTGTPVVTVNGTNITIVATTVFPACPVPPGAPQIQSYSYSADVGNLPNGTYTVVWNYVGDFDGSYTGTFTIARGQLQTVPVSSPAMMILLGAVLSLVGMAAIRR